MDEAALRRVERDVEDHGLPCSSCGRHAPVSQVDAYMDDLWVSRVWQPWVCAGCRR